MGWGVWGRAGLTETPFWLAVMAEKIRRLEAGRWFTGSNSQPRGTGARIGWWHWWSLAVELESALRCVGENYSGAESLAQSSGAWYRSLLCLLCLDSTQRAGNVESSTDKRIRYATPSRPALAPAPQIPLTHFTAA